MERAAGKEAEDLQVERYERGEKSSEVDALVVSRAKDFRSGLHAGCRRGSGGKALTPADSCCETGNEPLGNPSLWKSLLPGAGATGLVAPVGQLCREGRAGEVSQVPGRLFTRGESTGDRGGSGIRDTKGPAGSLRRGAGVEWLAPMMALSEKERLVSRGRRLGGEVYPPKTAVDWGGQASHCPGVELLWQLTWLWSKEPLFCRGRLVAEDASAGAGPGCVGKSEAEGPEGQLMNLASSSKAAK